ncbi:Hypothetical_protein [Hexamita inflata]|uniref:Hypothetical_protein n=1 Tax=Hexamita inflata TaxID=28002 RepID=A0AA86R905_9EUKA|nr:Hypothetical protein HINF_LOCUS59412 [Hexamita inflata]
MRRGTIEARSNEPIINHTKQSWHFSNASSALTSDAEPNRSLKERHNIQYQYIIYIGSLIWYIHSIINYFNHFRFGINQTIEDTKLMQLHLEDAEKATYVFNQ